MPPEKAARRDFLNLALVVPVLAVGCRSQKDAALPTTATDGKAESERNDAELFVQAARLEESAIKTYKIAAALPFIKSDTAVVTIAGRFMAQHAQHRDAMVQAARQFGAGTVDPSTAPMPPIPKDVLNAALSEAQRKVSVIRFARSLEMQAAKAYFEYITRKLRTEFGRKTAADILPVEAQHVAVYDALLQGVIPAPTSFFSEQV